MDGEREREREREREDGTVGLLSNNTTENSHCKLVIVNILFHSNLHPFGIILQIHSFLNNLEIEILSISLFTNIDQSKISNCKWTNANPKLLFVLPICQQGLFNLIQVYLPFKNVTQIIFWLTCNESKY